LQYSCAQAILMKFVSTDYIKCLCMLVHDVEVFMVILDRKAFVETFT